MAPLEVGAAGRPTIAYRGGGAVETILENVTGVFFDRQTPEDLGDAIEQFERRDWSSEVIRRHSESFSVEIFRERFRSFFRRIGTPVDMPRSESARAFVEAFERERAS